MTVTRTEKRLKKILLADVKEHSSTHLSEGRCSLSSPGDSADGQDVVGELIPSPYGARDAPVK